MNYKQDMQTCLTYIEEHLEEKITVSELADLLGYSLYHFCHVFKNVQDISVGAYLRQKQLNLAAKKLLRGDRITDVALSSGFDTHSGFTKAFHRQFGISPYEYQLKGVYIMTPEIKKMPALTAACYQFPAPEGDFIFLESGAYWLGQDYSSVSKEDYASITKPGYAEIGLWLFPDENVPELYYFLGAQVESVENIPEGLHIVQIPEAEYAVFLVPAAKDAKELQDNIRKTWKQIYTEWFDNSDWKYDETKYNFEYYLGENTYIYVPVLAK